MPELHNIFAKSPKPVVVDVETTGFGAHDRIVEIAVITLDPETWETQDEYDTLINPERDVGPTGVHGVTAGMVELAPVFADILPPVAQRLRGAVLIAHNLPFDTRMMRYEFERHRVPIDFGQGMCTLKATRAKLGAACQSEGIRLENAHRALADARATAELARRLRLATTKLSTRPVKVDALDTTTNARTHRRGLADAGTSPMHRVVCRSPYPHGDEAMAHYLDALDWVLDDGVIDRTERAAMDELAREWGLSRASQRQAHRSYAGRVDPRVPGPQLKRLHTLQGRMSRRSLPCNCAPRASHRPPGPRFGATLPSRPVGGPGSLPLSPRISLRPLRF